jgi:hypothetical protein
MQNRLETRELFPSKRSALFCFCQSISKPDLVSDPRIKLAMKIGYAKKISEKELI